MKDIYAKEAAEICGDHYWLVNVVMEAPQELEDRIAAALRKLGRLYDQTEEAHHQMRDWKDELLSQKAELETALKEVRTMAVESKPAGDIIERVTRGLHAVGVT